MPVCLQILIGALPVILTGIILILRKKLYVLPAVCMVFALAAVIFGLVYFDLGAESGADSVEEVSSSKEQLIYLAKYETAQGDAETAGNLLDLVCRSYGDDAEAVLQQARVQVLNGDLTAAVALYSKAEMLDADVSLADEEAGYVAMAAEGSILNAYDAAVAEAEIEYLTEQGLKAADYGFTLTAAEVAQCASGLKTFQTYLAEVSAAEAEEADYGKKEKTASQAIMNAAALLREAADAASGYGSYADTEQVLEVLDDVKTYIAQASGISAISWVDEAIVAGYQLTEDASGLLSYVSETGSSLGFGALADFYIQGVLSQEEAGEVFQGLKQEEYEELIARVQNTKAKLKTETEQDEQDLQDKVDALEQRAEDPILSALESGVWADTKPLEEQSKLYLIKSMLNYELQNDDSGAECLNEALKTAPYCDDADYVEVMGMISAILNGTADSNAVKNVGDYLTEAYEMTFPVWKDYRTGEDESMADSQGGKKAASLTLLGTSGTAAGEEKEGTETEENEAGSNGRDLDSGISSRFLNGATNYVSTAKAMINISEVDASGFPTVKLRLQTTRQLNVNHPNITLWDAGLEIENYSITEVSYDGAWVALVCDTSGSMSGQEASLQEAVSKYIADLSEGEQVEIVAFSESVKFSSGFSDDTSYFVDYISRLDANGGTNIASGVWSAINGMQTGENSYRALIVMTDGEDSSFSDDDLKTLNETCEMYGITVYTIGLGESIQAEYLESIAAAGNGQFVYCSDISQLDALYEFIHSQMQNSYDITFTALNTELAERTVAVQNGDDGAYAQRDYTVEATEEEEGPQITSIDEDSIYKKDAAVTFHLLGENFERDTEVSVVISGDMGRYALTPAYQSGTQITVTIPADVPIGTYELTAAADQSIYTTEIELYSEYSELTFGAYTFTAQKIKVTETEAVISGDVTMNGFLHFNGTVTLQGNVEEDLAVTLVDNSGSYVVGTDEVSGIIGYLYGNTIYFGAFGSFTIYNDQEHLNDLNNYRVDVFSYWGYNLSIVIAETGTMSMYPHMISFTIAEISLKLPLQKEIMAGLNEGSGFTAEANLKALVVSEGLRLSGKVSESVKKDFKLFKTLSAYVSKFEVEFNTYDKDYSFEFEIATNKIVPIVKGSDNDDAKYGFSIEIEEGFLESLTITADVDIKPNKASPVTVSDLSFGISGVKDAAQDSSLAGSLLKFTWEGGCKISLYKIKELLPATESIFKNLALLSVEDCTVGIRFSNFKFEVEAKAKFLGLEIGNGKLTLGNYSYSNYLLGISGENDAGIYLDIVMGPTFSMGNFSFTVQGEAEFAIDFGDGYKGVWVNGVAEYDITFVKHFANSVDGNLVLASHNNGTQFTILIKGSDLKKNKDAGFKLTLSDGWPSLKFY